MRLNISERFVIIVESLEGCISEIDNVVSKCAEISHFLDPELKLLKYANEEQKFVVCYFGCEKLVDK